MKLEKTCKIHGVLEEKDIRKCISDHYKLGYNLRCKICAKEGSWRRYLQCKTHGKLEPEDLKKNGRCKFCHREGEKSRREKDGFNDLRRQKIQADKEKNPEKWKDRFKRDYQASVKKHGSEERNTKEIIRMHGLTRDQYDQMVREQENKCKICLMPETRAGRTKGTITRLSVDHCHKTQKVRGLLCYKCNLMLGYAEDRDDVLEMAAIYLRES